MTTAREALLSLAAELDAAAKRPAHPEATEDQARYAQGAAQAAAELARQRATGLPQDTETPSPVSRDGVEASEGTRSREALGALVRKAWTEWATEQPGPKPSWLTPWEELDEGQREVGMRIGEAVAAATAATAAKYDNAINWQTSCLNCATLLDSCYAETCRREQAEEKVTAVRAVAERWAAQAPADDWGESMATTVQADAGRMLLGILDGKP